MDALSTLSQWPGTFRQNHLDLADEVAEVDGIHVFLIENQGVWMAGLKPTVSLEADAAVWLTGWHDWSIVEPSCGPFLLKATLEELVLGSNPTASDPDDVSALGLLDGLTRLDELGPMTWAGTTSFFAGRDELAMRMEGDANARPWVLRARRPGTPI